MLLLAACEESDTPFKRNLSLEAFDDMKADEYALNAPLVREYLEHISRADNDSCLSASRVKKYYREKGGIVWIDALGIDCRADSLLSTLKARLPEMGFNMKVFKVKQISDDLDRMHTLNFD